MYVCSLTRVSSSRAVWPMYDLGHDEQGTPHSLSALLVLGLLDVPVDFVT